MLATNIIAMAQVLCAGANLISDCECGGTDTLTRCVKDVWPYTSRMRFVFPLVGK